MNWLHSSSIQLVIRDLNEIAADAYRHRIRPSGKRGGNGAYDKSRGGISYQLPRRLVENERAHFDILSVEAEKISLRATSLDSPTHSVSAAIDSRGQLVDIRLPGQPQRVVPVVHQISENVGSLTGRAISRPMTLVFEDKP